MTMVIAVYFVPGTTPSASDVFYNVILRVNSQIATPAKAETLLCQQRFV